MAAAAQLYSTFSATHSLLRNERQEIGRTCGGEGCLEHSPTRLKYDAESVKKITPFIRQQASVHPFSSSCSRRTGGHASLVRRQWSSVQRGPCHLGQPVSVRASVNPSDDPILSKALQEPVAFLGGLFAGLLRLDLSEDPLKEWVSRTAEAAGVDLEESKEDEEDGPVEIMIE